MHPVPQIRVRHLRGASLEALKEDLRGDCPEEQLLCTEIISNGNTAPAELRATYQVQPKTGVAEDDLLHLLRTCAKTIRPVLERNRSMPGCDLQPYLPGHASFVCAQNECVNPCCNAATLQIVVSPQVQDAIVAAHGLPKEEFLTLGSPGSGASRGDTGFQILQAKASGCCVFLSEAENRCGIHEVRPDPCRMYPFEVAFFQLKSQGDVGWIPDRIIRGRANGQTVDFFKKGELGYNYLIPLIMYHASCPGLTGATIRIEEYIELVHQLWGLSERMSRTILGADA